MPEEKKIHCNLCKHETNHVMLSSHNQNYLIEGKESGQRYIEYYEKSRYGFWVCKGCDTATLEEKYTISGMYDALMGMTVLNMYTPQQGTINIKEKLKNSNI